MAGERLDFDIFARLREDGFAKAAKAAEGASGEVIKLAERLDKLGAKSTEARIKLTGDKAALAQLDKLQLKMIAVGEKIIDPTIDIKGEAVAQAKLAALSAELDKLGSKSAGATSAVGSGGLAGPAGMGALIGAGVVLSPILTTLAFGVGGFGLAAAGAVAPILKAAKATGGLQANMAKLNPEQQKLAKSILGLGKQYDVFQKQLEPQVLNVFGKGIELAGHLMHDVQPIAAATGKALGTMLGRIDDEFKSGTWQKFFGFMAATAGPDVRLVTDNLTSFMELLPPLLMDLQPLGTAILNVSNDLLKLSDAAAKGFGSLTSVNSAASDTPKHANLASQAWHIWEKAVRGAEDATAHLFSWIPGLNTATGKTAAGIHDVGTEAAATKQPVFNLTTAISGLTDAMDKNVKTVLTLQGDEITWRQSMQAATKQLESNSAGLRGNSKDALANKAAVLQDTQNAVAFADSQLKLGGNLHAASRVIQDQIHWLQVHGGKSRFARQEIHALRMEENKLQAVIRNKILVSASGFWRVTGALQGGVPQRGGPGPRPVQSARGTFVSQGQPGVDDQLILAQRGELVVPTRLVSAGLVDHLRGMIPGFDSGGVISSYSGSVGGAPKWLAREDAATLRAVDVATAAATTAAIKSAQAAAAASGGFGVAGPGGGAPAANAALARRMFPSVDWPSWNYVAMRESGWNQFARNPSSGAYGIPQALPPSKMGPAANPPQSNPAAQISWMVGYMNSRYGGSPGAAAHERAFNWYADGGVVGDAKWPRPPRPPKHDPQRKKWLDQLARDVRVLQADEKHARERRRLLHRELAIEELWFLTHPHVKKGGIGWNEHEKSLRLHRRMLRHFNRTENARETELSRKIAILRLLTHYPKGRKYGGPGTPAPPGDGGGAGDGSGGGDTGGGAPPPAPSGPPPIPPPPMPDWMVTAGLGSGGGGFSFPVPVMPPPAFGGGMSWPDPVTPRYYGGGRFMPGGGGGGFDLGAVISAIQAMHQDMVGAVGRVAPGMSRGVDRSLNSMTARVAGRFS